MKQKICHKFVHTIITSFVYTVEDLYEFLWESFTKMQRISRIFPLALTAFLKLQTFMEMCGLHERKNLIEMVEASRSFHLDAGLGEVQLQRVKWNFDRKIRMEG